MLKSRMHPTAQHARSINGQQSSLDQERNHARTEQLLQRRVIAGARRVFTTRGKNETDRMKDLKAKR